MEINIQGKKAFVCGSTQGIGKAAAIELANLGASIVLLARNEDSLKRVKDELNTAQNQQHDYIVADFSKPDELKNKVAEYFETNSLPVHILINNTGGPPAGKSIEAKLEEFINAFQTALSFRLQVPRRSIQTARDLLFIERNFRRHNRPYIFVHIL